MEGEVYAERCAGLLYRSKASAGPGFRVEKIAAIRGDLDQTLGFSPVSHVYVDLISMHGMLYKSLYMGFALDLAILACSHVFATRVASYSLVRPHEVFRGNKT